MNDTAIIASMQSIGNTPPAQGMPPQSGRGAQDSHGLPFFLSHILQQLQAAAPDAAAALPGSAAATIPGSTAALPTDGLQALTEKIAALLKAGDALPASLRNLSPDDLAAALAKIAPGAASSDAAIEPSLVSDLAGSLATQIQEEKPEHPEKADIPLTELTDLLNALQPGADAGSEVAKILALLQAQQPAPGADILQQLKDKISALSLTTGELNKDVLVTFKADVLQSLQDKGMEPSDIERFLAKLAKFLRKDDAPETENAAVTMPLRHAATANQRPDAPDDNAPLSARMKDAAPELHQTPEQPPASANRKNDAPPPVLPVQQAQPQAPAPKTAGAAVITTAMIDALAGNDGNFGSNGFGSGSGDQHADGTNNAPGTLRAATVDVQNNQNFANYLATARNAPSPVTQMVNVQLQRNINARIDMMTLQLEPADLGRMDIRLTFDKDGGIKAHLSVDRPETLALLQKDAHYLEKVLQQTGLDVDENALSFDLRQQGRQQNLDGYTGGGNAGNGDEFSTHMDGARAEQSILAKIAVSTNGYITQSGVNIMV